MPETSTQADIGTHHPREAFGSGGQNARGYHDRTRDQAGGTARRIEREIAAAKKDRKNAGRIAAHARTDETDALEAAAVRASLERGSRVITAALNTPCPRPDCGARPTVWCYSSCKGLHAERRALGAEAVDRNPPTIPSELEQLAAATRNAQRNGRSQIDRSHLARKVDA